MSSLKVLLGSAAMAIFTIGAFWAFHQHPTAPVNQIVPGHAMASAVSQKLAVANRSLPMRLQIPKINVDANILYMGITKTGAMDTPGNVTDVGWYKYGPLPGNQGSAVIAGHIDGLSGQPGVFSNLDKLQVGDSLSVSDTNGRIASFVVREIKTYGQSDQSNGVFSSGSGAHLNLITCAGGWDAAQHRFLQRLVVFADKSA